MLAKLDKCWVVVADSALARIFRYDQEDQKLIQLSVKSPARHWRLAKRLSQPATGRVFDSVGKGRHTMNRPADAEEKIERKFLTSLVHELKKKARQGRFERLVLIADPRSLGLIREKSGALLQNYIIEEAPLDLAHVPTKELMGHVKKILYP